MWIEASASSDIDKWTLWIDRMIANKLLQKKKINGESKSRMRQIWQFWSKSLDYSIFYDGLNRFLMSYFPIPYSHSYMVLDCKYYDLERGRMSRASVMEAHFHFPPPAIYTNVEHCCGPRDHKIDTKFDNCSTLFLGVYSWGWSRCGNPRCVDITHCGPISMRNCNVFVVVINTLKPPSQMDHEIGHLTPEYPTPPPFPPLDERCFTWGKQSIWFILKLLRYFVNLYA